MLRGNDLELEAFRTKAAITEQIIQYNTAKCIQHGPGLSPETMAFLFEPAE